MHYTSSHLNRNHSSVITARNCFPSLNLRYNWSKSWCIVCLAKNNQTKTIWRYGMLFDDANKNMFKMINMKDLHNFRRTELLVLWALWITAVMALCSQHYMIYWGGRSSFLLNFRWWKLIMSVTVLLPLNKSNCKSTLLCFAVNKRSFKSI